MAFDRGNTIFFNNITFRDSSDAAVNVTTANLKINYKHLLVATTTSVTLASSGGVWSGSWDSGVADAGTVYCSIQAVTTGAADVVRDFTIQLKANVANELSTA